MGRARTKYLDSRNGSVERFTTSRTRRSDWLILVPFVPQLIPTNSGTRPPPSFSPRASSWCSFRKKCLGSTFAAPLGMVCLTVGENSCSRFGLDQALRFRIALGPQGAPCGLRAWWKFVFCYQRLGEGGQLRFCRGWEREDESEPAPEG